MNGKYKMLNRIVKKLTLLISFYSIILTCSAEEVSLGKIDAPVTIIEYGSITCDYCIHFHRKVLPNIKASYIDTGKVRFIYRHFPTSEPALQAAIAAQCSGGKYYEMLDRLYLSTADWLQADNRNQIFVKQANSLGIDSALFSRCLNDKKQRENIIVQQREASEKYDVIGTPTFIINNKVISGKTTFSEMESILNKML